MNRSHDATNERLSDLPLLRYYLSKFSLTIKTMDRIKYFLVEFTEAKVFRDENRRGEAVTLEQHVANWL